MKTLPKISSNNFLLCYILKRPTAQLQTTKFKAKGLLPGARPTRKAHSILKQLFSNNITKTLLIQRTRAAVKRMI